jgi:hypothetical protein
MKTKSKCAKTVAAGATFRLPVHVGIYGAAVVQWTFSVDGGGIFFSAMFKPFHDDVQQDKPEAPRWVLQQHAGQALYL